jgi:hypothetical protein
MGVRERVRNRRDLDKPASFHVLVNPAIAAVLGFRSDPERGGVISVMTQREGSGAALGAGIFSPVPNSRPARALLASLAIALAVLGACAAAAASAGVPFSDLSRDPSEILKSPFYLGALSHLGILVWCSSAAICLFAAAFPVRDSRWGEQGRFLLVSGVLTAWLVVDDLLTLHEVALPNLLSVRQRYVFAAYAVAVALYLVRFRRVLLDTDYPLLIVAFVFFGVSVLSDAVQARFPLPGHHYVEDCSKMLGIVAWTVYFARTAMRHVRLRDEPGERELSDA